VFHLRLKQICYSLRYIRGQSCRPQAGAP